ncbi:ABC transporter ATP-binding protein [Candidatus Aerophobetes bacterium]|uniref:ABC transporter ATP-binding protein n=1 Tax=Aerophobetes bacterium TaxID=2030807 RepID=A0A523W6M9_UNCAE|nr:MAG: ABC transporter ATP-binding protein [Candidatus Aerophobetes bacterium]
MNVQRRLLGYLRPYRGKLALALVCMVLVSLTTLALPWILGRELIDRVILGKNVFLLNLIAIALVILVAVKGLFSYGQTYLMSFVGYRLITDLRNQIYQHLQQLSLSFYKRKRTGEIMSRVVTDVNVLQEIVVESVAKMILNLLIIAGVLGFIFYIHWKLSLCVLAVVPLLALTVRRFGSRIKKFSTLVQVKIADISSLLQETIAGIEVVKSFATEEEEVRKFQQENIRNFRLAMRRTRVVALLSPLVEILTTIGLSAILWYGAREVITGGLTTGKLIAFLGYVSLVTHPLNQLGKTYSLYQRALASAERIFEILDTEPEIKELPGAIQLPPIEGHIRFKDVSFGYNSKELILENISLEIKPGESVALVGPSGVGKSTLVSLIPRFYDSTSGVVSIDGYDVKKVKLASLRQQISIVPQETILFNGTIGDNIAYGRPEATDEEIAEAAKRSNADRFIESLSQGYDTEVGERGVKVSGGERQRIAIARAILRNPRILILDEATSAVDSETELLIQQALRRLMKDRSTLIIAHRLSTIQNVNKVVVLSKRRIEDIGSHEELLAQRGFYTKLYKNQFRPA